MLVFQQSMSDDAYYFHYLPIIYFYVDNEGPCIKISYFLYLDVYFLFQLVVVIVIISIIVIIVPHPFNC